MRNIELKAILRDRASALAACRELGASPKGDIIQLDTYFHVPEGRLKLRESNPGDDYLVFYRRPDLEGAKACDYLISVVDRGIKGILTEALGIKTIVTKVRTLFLWKNVRIHIDKVEDLGDYIEFEAVLSEDNDAGEATAYQDLILLQEVFSIKDDDRIDKSYADFDRQ